MKGVVLAGGTGSRLEPLTRVTNKHLLPVGEKPMVQWAVDALEEAGVRDLILVTGSDHVEDFRRYFGKDLQYAQQLRPGGIAEALGLARDFAGDDRLVVMLADNIYGGSIAETIRRFEAQATGARVLLAYVRETEHLRHLGVPRIEGERIVEILEKPADPPGKLAVTGLYCYDTDVFDAIADLQPSARGELEITDVNNHYVRAGTLEYDVFPGYWGDAGESIDAYYEVIDRARRPHFGSERTRSIPLRRFEDPRGWLVEIARTSGLPKPIRQTNVSLTRKGTASRGTTHASAISGARNRRSCRNGTRPHPRNWRRRAARPRAAGGIRGRRPRRLDARELGRHVPPAPTGSTPAPRAARGGVDRRRRRRGRPPGRRRGERRRDAPCRGARGPARLLLDGLRLRRPEERAVRRVGCAQSSLRVRPHEALR